MDSGEAALHDSTLICSEGIIIDRDTINTKYPILASYLRRLVSVTGQLHSVEISKLASVSLLLTANNILNISVFDALSNGGGLMAAIILCLNR